ncbi:SAG1386/EF1546 family surface-associated protein [Lactococcus sp.]|uniref:SAG1386/EF1546 family surface-associated protein n=1 Tax=Lactococcus sp. TaxID=44273 RepID=UPI0035B242D7
MATKEPWNNEIYKAMREEPEDYNRQSRTKNEEKKPFSTVFLTILVVIMFVLITLALAFVLWNSAIQNSKSITSSFNNGSSSAAQQSTAASSSAATSSSSSVASSTSSSSQTQSSSSSAAAGTTYTIKSGDTPSKIAAETGVSWSVIASLNNITTSGYNADGSAIYAGQVIKLK